MFNNRTAIAVIGVLATSLTLAACSPGGTGAGSNPPSAPSAATESFNNQDVTFAQAMIQHHRQAIDMAQVILDKSGIDSRVTELAIKIKSAQGPEIDDMNSWLMAWGVSAGSASGMGHDMSGMMSKDDTAALDAATGIDASRLFLQQMTKHHQGAIDMAQTEVKNGKSPDSLSLARTIIKDQMAEIDVMRVILSKL